MRAIAFGILWLLIGASTAALGQDAKTLVITTAPSQAGGVRQKINIELHAKGGLPPYSWQLISGKLPLGLKLDPAAGTIAGAPQDPGVYHVTVGVQDSDVPPLQAQRDFVLTVSAAAPVGTLTIEWKQAPAIYGDEISGSVEVANHSGEPFDLTVVVLAVNDIGRATALGYQHFTLQPQLSQVIPFGASPGEGVYIVHADAVAEVASTNSIYRARKQTANPLTLNAP